MKQSLFSASMCFAKSQERRKLDFSRKDESWSNIWAFNHSHPDFQHPAFLSRLISTLFIRTNWRREVGTWRSISVVRVNFCWLELIKKDCSSSYHYLQCRHLYVASRLPSFSLYTYVFSKTQLNWCFFSALEADSHVLGFLLLSFPSYGTLGKLLNFSEFIL